MSLVQDVKHVMVGVRNDMFSCSNGVHNYVANRLDGSLPAEALTAVVDFLFFTIFGAGQAALKTLINGAFTVWHTGRAIVFVVSPRDGADAKVEAKLAYKHLVFTLANAVHFLVLLNPKVNMIEAVGVALALSPTFNHKVVEPFLRNHPALRLS